MGKWIRALCAALTLLLIPAPEAASVPEAAVPQVRCLAIGIDHFVTEEDTAPCSANNAERMAALFGACLPEGTRVTRSVNGPGSPEEAEALIRAAFDGAGEADTAFLYLSTHGLREEDGSAAFILSDGTREEKLTAAELRRMMDAVPGNKILILDCCRAGAAAEAFRGPEWRVLAGCGPEEDCLFWAAGEVTGMGYFTSALESALLAGNPALPDADGNGSVSLKELAERVREIYGVADPVFLPEGDESPLFMPPGEPAAEQLTDLRFDPQEEAEGAVTLRFRFRTDTTVRVEYRLIPRTEAGWDFSRGIRMPDRERTGQTRGMMSPGDKERMIRVSPDRLGEAGEALLQIISWRGLHGQIPVIEATRRIRAR